MGFWDKFDEQEAQRQAEEEAREAAYRAQREEFRQQRGYLQMHREPVLLPMYHCLRCSTLAFDPDAHDEWHRSMGQERRP